MTVLSKFLGAVGFRIITNNCYEIAHTWNPSCFGSAKVVWFDGFKECLKVYTTLYALTTLLRRPAWKDLSFTRLGVDILRSTAFLSTQVFLFIYLICINWKLSGFFILPCFGFINGFFSSFFSILIEQKRRRGMLALYLTNLASEVLFRMLKHRGYVKSIPKGQVLVFASALAGYMYLFKKENWLDNSTKKLLKFSLDCGEPKEIFDTSSLPHPLAALLVKLRGLNRHEKCDHHFHSCLSAAVEKFVRHFGIGAVVSTALLVPRLLQSPTRAFKSLFSFKFFSLPLFFGALPAAYSSCLCLQNRHTNFDSATKMAVSGFAAGLALIFFPNTSIAMYVAWKLIEVFYFKGVEKDILPKWKHGDIWLYSFSTAFVLFGAVMEPHALRPGYWKFLMGLTGNRFSQIYRKLLDTYGFDSSKVFPNFVPDLNPVYTTENPALMPK